MRRIFNIYSAVSLIVSLVLLSACTKEGPARFKGNYSFKTSGSVLLVKADDASGSGGSSGQDGTGNGSGVAEPQDRISAMIATESGQMDILTVDKSSGDMIITMNIIAGDAVTMDAVASGDRLEIVPFQRHVTLKIDETIMTNALVTVKGYGERFDNVVIFRMSYEGSCTHLTATYNISESSIQCVAKRNDY